MRVNSRLQCNEESLLYSSHLSQDLVVPEPEHLEFFRFQPSRPFSVKLGLRLVLSTIQLNN